MQGCLVGTAETASGATICLNCQKTTASAAIIDTRISRKQRSDVCRCSMNSWGPGRLQRMGCFSRPLSCSDEWLTCCCPRALAMLLPKLSSRGIRVGCRRFEHFHQLLLQVACRVCGALPLGKHGMHRFIIRARYLRIHFARRHRWSQRCPFVHLQNTGNVGICTYHVGVLYNAGTVGGSEGLRHRLACSSGLARKRTSIAASRG